MVGWRLCAGGEVREAGLPLSQKGGSGPDKEDFRLYLFIINRVY